MTIQIDPTRITLTPSLPKDRPVLRHPNIATLDNLLAAIDDAETQAYNSEEHVPDEWLRVFKLKRMLEAGR